MGYLIRRGEDDQRGKYAACSAPMIIGDIVGERVDENACHWSQSIPT